MHTPDTWAVLAYFVTVAMGIMVHVFDRMLKKAPKLPTESLSMWSFIFSWSVITFVAGLIIAIGFGVLSMTPPESRIAIVLFSIGFSLLLFKLCAWIAFERSESNLEKALFIGIVCAAAGVLWYASVAFAGSKLPSTVSHLRFDALPTNIGYVDNFQIAGVVWKKGYADVRITIKSEYQYPMVNVNITMIPTDPKVWFVGLAQTSAVSGVEFHKSPLPVPAPNIQINGDDGVVGNITPMLDEALEKVFGPLATEYRVSCPRLESGESIKITAIMLNRRNLGVAPDRFKLTGSYETAPSEGSIRIPIDQEVEIKR